MRSVLIRCWQFQPLDLRGHHIRLDGEPQFQEALVHLLQAGEVLFPDGKAIAEQALDIALSSIAAAFYAGLLSLINGLYLLLWWYASSRHRLISPTLEQDVITSVRVRRLLHLSVFVISIGLALLNPYVALVVWVVGWVPTNFVPLRRSKSSSKGDE